jgi:hypothetical protein
MGVAIQVTLSAWVHRSNRWLMSGLSVLTCQLSGQGRAAGLTAEAAIIDWTFVTNKNGFESPSKSYGSISGLWRRAGNIWHVRKDVIRPEFLNKPNLHLIFERAVPPP